MVDDSGGITADGLAEASFAPAEPIGSTPAVSGVLADSTQTMALPPPSVLSASPASPESTNAQTLTENGSDAMIASSASSTITVPKVPLPGSTDGLSTEAAEAHPTNATASVQAKIVQSPDKATRPRQTRAGIEFEVATQINGASAGRLSLLIQGGDLHHPEYVCDDIAVRLADIVTLIRPKMNQALFEKLISSAYSQEYVTFNDLRSHGISVSFDRHDRLQLKAV